MLIPPLSEFQGSCNKLPSLYFCLKKTSWGGISNSNPPPKKKNISGYCVCLCFLLDWLVRTTQAPKKLCLQICCSSFCVRFLFGNIQSSLQVLITRLSGEHDPYPRKMALYYTGSSTTNNQLKILGHQKCLGNSHQHQSWKRHTLNSIPDFGQFKANVGRDFP